ncbi:hypothetical protein [Pseudolysinimonas sp.]|uniref:hypothetical protein n=1 Tax=Pseudolysinimonas sp. TaxID=2680009 RepID=UPI003F8034FD
MSDTTQDPQAAGKALLHGKIDMAEKLGIVDAHTAHRGHLEVDALTPERVISQPTQQEWIQLIRIERNLQVEAGYTQEHDDEHGPFHLLNQAVEYARLNKPVESSALIVAAIQLLHRIFAIADAEGPIDPDEHAKQQAEADATVQEA